jgi:ribose 5-phosphate isomerase
VPVLGKLPLPVEVIPMTRSYGGGEIVKMGGTPVLREKFTTDNGNLILDCHGLDLVDLPRVEARLDGIAGVVTQRHLRAAAGGRTSSWCQFRNPDPESEIGSLTGRASP